MADRLVTRICRFRTGEIIALCNPFEPWSPVTVFDACNDIVSESHSYYLKVGGVNLPISLAHGNGESLLVACSRDGGTDHLELLPEADIQDVLGAASADEVRSPQ